MVPGRVRRRRPWPHRSQQQTGERFTEATVGAGDEGDRPFDVQAGRETGVRSWD